MPELRKDPVTGSWVIIAIERGKRPSDFQSPKEEETGSFCPFCNGNEHVTPPEIAAYRTPGTAPNTPGWQVRVVPNKFPALAIEGDLGKRADGIYDRMNGVGAHEVIIETPDHGKGLADLELPHVRQVIQMYKERVADLGKDHRLKYSLVFKNWGQTAGASLSHTHSQIIATPVVPILVNEEIAGAARYRSFRERCVFCDILDQDLADGSRIVFENKSMVCLTPFASKSPFETWLLPKEHLCAFEDTTDPVLDDFAEALKETLTRIKVTLDDPPFNFMLHTAPYHEHGLPHYHWHLEIVPRLTKLAGFEWGSGFYINPTPPEQAAEFLREALASIDAPTH